ncbi:MAG: hypothetical protein RL678_418, partial [Pseudomonadota bacterium]
VGFPSEYGAGEESRTLDLNLGKVALYQLSYSRVADKTSVLRQTRDYSLAENFVNRGQLALSQTHASP